MNTFRDLGKQPAQVSIDVGFLLMYKLPDGGGFPPSYIDFATHLGWGRLGGLFLVYVPLGQHPDSWLVRSPWIKQQMDVFYEEMEHDPFLLEPDGYPGLEESLIPFAMSENGEYLAWDSAKRDVTGELPIYVLTSRMGSIQYAGKDLYELVERCTDATAVKAVMGPGYHPLPLTFEPL